MTVIGLSLTAAGCGAGAGPEPQVLPVATEGPGALLASDASPAATRPADVSPTPTATATAMPPSAREHTPEGAEDFVRYWVAVANDAFATGDTSAWRALNTPSCKTCEARINDVEDAYGAGGRIEGGQLQILNLAATPVEPGIRTLVVVDFDVTPEIHVDTAGQELSKGRSGPTKFVFFMQWDRPEWRVAAVKLGVKQ